MKKRTNWKKEFDNIFMCHALTIDMARKTLKENSKVSAMKFLKEFTSKHKSWKTKRG